MKKMVCEICQNQNFKKVEDQFICQGCGTSYSAEAAKALLIEVEDSHNNDSQSNESQNSEIANLYELARRAYKGSNYSLAEKHYSELMLKCPKDWEANFYQTYCDSMECKILEIGIKATRIEKAALTSLELAKEHVKKEELSKVANEILVACLGKAISGFSSAQGWYNNASFSVRGRFTQDMLNYCYPCVTLLYSVADKVNEMVEDKSDELVKTLVSCWKTAIDYHEKLIRFLADTVGHKNKMNTHINKVRGYEPSYKVNVSTNNVSKVDADKKEKMKKYIKYAIIIYLSMGFIGGLIALIINL